MRFRLLGPVEAEVDGQRVDLGRRRERCLLALLLLEPGHVVPTSRLADLLWDGSPGPQAPSAVRIAVARLRCRLSESGLMDRGELVTRGDGYLLDVEADRVDVHRFHRLVAQARSQHDAAASAAMLSEALGLWRGPALADVAGGWLRDRICAPLEEQRLNAWEDLNDLELALGSHAAIVGRLRGQVAEHPLRERLRGQLMLALYRSSRRAEALAVYRAGWRILADEHGLELGPQLRGLERAIHANDPSLDGARGPSRPARVGHTAISRPAADSPSLVPSAGGAFYRRFDGMGFFGRRDELRELPDLLTSGPLVTLVGPPGSGKTRLARELLTTGFTARFRDGVAVVELETIAEPSHVVPSIAAALGWHHHHVAGGVRWLVGRLRNLQLLLVLDNCEHLLGECARIITEVVGQCGGVRVLSTSREPLGISRELVHEVGPLDVPATDSLEAVLASAAGSMFLACGSHAVDLSSDNAPHIATLCRLVDGLPLAIELAAARLRTITLEQMTARLHRQLDVLSRRSGTADRHRSLRAALDWSYNLLTDTEGLLLARISVFSGSFTLDAAEACAADDDLPARVILDTLCTLVDRSLVAIEDARASRRFRLLEVVRQYSEERLVETRQLDTVRRRHAEYFAEFAEDAHRRRRSDWLGCLHAVEAEYTNLRAAVDWSCRRAPELAVRIVGALQWYWFRRDAGDGRLLAQRAIAASADLPGELRQRALLTLGSIEMFADPPNLDRLEEGLTLAESSDDPTTAIPFIVNLSFACWVRGDLKQALQQAQRAHQLAGAGSDYARARTAALLGFMLGYTGNWPAAKQTLTTGRELFTRLGDERGVTEVGAVLGELAYLHGDSTLAEHTLQEVINAGDLLVDSYDWTRSRTILGWICLERGQPEAAQQFLCAAFATPMRKSMRLFTSSWLTGLGLALAAGIAHARGDDHRAAVLLGTVQHAQQAPTAGPPGLTKPRHDKLITAVAANLSEDELDIALRRGASMSITDSLTYAVHPASVTAA